MITILEAYLLSKMRAKELVQATLDKEGWSQGELKARAMLGSRKWNLDRPGHDASIYFEAIGAPVSERLLIDGEIDSVFAGSVRREYRLGLWPQVLFVVNQHPTGYAWGEGFVQPEPMSGGFEPARIVPWEWVADRIQALAATIEVVEHWNDEKDLRLRFCGAASVTTYLAKFDFNLLQEWALVKEDLALEPLARPR